ncbi:MAG: ATP-dependent protease ATPase subunit HslU [Candidatus Brocadiia bacterium]
MSANEMTPRELVKHLDKYIIGQNEAKKAVAVAVRNRWRRLQLPAKMAEEVNPKNIIMIGPTGVGKTEISKRLAQLIKAPFLKVEATKFTEVGYVGRDVDTIVRDLVKMSITMVENEEIEKLGPRINEIVDERILDILLPAPSYPPTTGEGEDPHVRYAGTREKLRKQLKDGLLDSREVEIPVTNEPSGKAAEVFSAGGFEEISNELSDMLGRMIPGRQQMVRVPIASAREMLKAEEARKLIDQKKVVSEAISRAENTGIVFIDEIDKVASRPSPHGPDVSREGVQRDLLPIIEGSTVHTRWGMIRTNHILFIAAGAFHISKPSDLIPEMQGRFPIRVELSPLTAKEFARILVEPENALVKQYSALLGTEGVDIKFTETSIEEMARIAEDLNTRLQNIGARRLHTVLEKVLEEISFTAPEMPGKSFRIDARFVRSRLSELLKDEDMSHYIL